MTNTAVLMSAIVEADFTLDSLAEAINLDDGLLCDKIMGREEFTLSEVKELVGTLNLDPSLTYDIFLS